MSPPLWPDPILRSYQRLALERLREELRAKVKPQRDPIDSWGVRWARGRLAELDRWILEFNPSGSRSLLGEYERERCDIRKWLARGGRK